VPVALRSLLLVFVLVLPAIPAWGYVAKSAYGFEITVDVSGPKPINQLQWESDAVTAVYQGEGEVTITVTATYTSTDENWDGYVALEVGDGGNGFVKFTTEESGFGWATATGTVDLDQYNYPYLDVYLTGSAAAEYKWNPFITQIWLYKNRVLSIPGTVGETFWSESGDITVTLLGIELTPAYSGWGVTSSYFQVPGETIHANASGFLAEPRNVTTDELGRARFNFLPVETTPDGISPPGFAPMSFEPDDPLRTTSSWFMSTCTGSPLPTDDVNFGTGKGDISQPRRIAVSYATITAVSGDVRVKNSFSGEWMIAGSGCMMAKEDILFLGPKDTQTYVNPSVTVQFFDRSTGVTTGYFTKSSANLYIKLGDFVETEDYFAFVTDVRNLAWDISLNPIEWGKSAVTYGLGKGVEFGLGGYGWVTQKVGGEVVKYLVRRMDDWATGAQQMPRLLRPDSITLPPPQVDSRVVATMAPAEQYGADIFNSYHADGKTDIINRGQARTITDGTTTVILPPWSMVSVDLSQGTAPSAAVPIITASFEKPFITVDPPPDSTVASLQPKLTFTYSGSVPVMPSSFTVRLNDYLVSRSMRPGTTSTSWFPPIERPLVRGENQIRASITTIHGVTSRAFLRLYAEPPLPIPDPPNVYPGRTSIAISWKDLRDPSVVGYKVLRAATEEGPGVEISTGILTHNLFVDPAPLAGVNHYRIAARLSTSEWGPESGTSSAALLPNAAATVPAAVLGLTATPGDRTVRVSFEKAPGAIGYRIERRAGSGAWENVVPNDGLVHEPPFIDPLATNTVVWRYRVTPIGNDAIAGVAAETAPVTPEDLAPAPPEGVTTDPETGVWVEWNPSPEADLLGYHVERGGPTAPFIRLTASPVTARRYFDASPGSGLHAYRVIAIDSAFHESEPSVVVSAYVRGSIVPVTPTGLRAEAVSTSQVEIYWNAVAGASYYVVERKAPGGAWQELSAPTNHWQTDPTVSAGTAYLYRVRAMGPAGMSAFTSPELATTITFTDSPLLPGTGVKALHLTQVRSAEAAVRQLAGLAAYPFTSTPASGSLIRAVHLTELRTALNQGRNALGLSTLAFTDSALAGQRIKAIHIEELRDGVK
jgi:hypothetical protein